MSQKFIIGAAHRAVGTSKARLNLQTHRQPERNSPSHISYSHPQHRSFVLVENPVRKKQILRRITITSDKMGKLKDVGWYAQSLARGTDTWRGADSSVSFKGLGRCSVIAACSSSWG